MNIPVNWKMVSGKTMSKLEPHTGISHRMHLSHLQSWEKTLSTPHDKAIVEHAIKTLC
jgi:hypothetical protein